MAGVFVSYAREDAAKAEAMARALEQAGFETWFDQRIHSGLEFSREIEQALAEACAVVVLWSKASIESAWVRDEAAEGRDSGRLIAVLLDDSRPPIGFRQYQATDLAGWSGRGKPKLLGNVIDAVRAKAGGAATPQNPIPSKVQGHTAPWAVALLLLVLAGSAGWYLTRTPSHVHAGLSVAVLPFTASAGDDDARALASAAQSAVTHTLSEGVFSVTSPTSAGSDTSPEADFTISGHVAGAAGKIAATVQMEESKHHIVVYSRQFETTRDKSAGFAELIGAQVAAIVSWTAPLLEIELRHPSDPSIIATLLQSSIERLDTVATLHDYEASRRVAAKAPHSPLAQNVFAFNTAFALGDLPRSERASAVAAGRRAADRTIELAPEFGGAYIPWCLLHSEFQSRECEDRLRMGLRADPDSPFNTWFLAILLNNVGRNADASEIATLSLAHDRYMPFKIALMLRMLAINGQWDEEAALFRQANAWWPANEAISWYRLTGAIESGNFEALRRLRREPGQSDPLEPLFAALRANSARAGQAACSNVGPNGLDATVCMLALAKLGNLEGAYRFADSLYPSRRGRTPADVERIWLEKPDPTLTAFLTAPVAAPLRHDPRFITLADRIGLLDYWRSDRLPDFCRPPNPEPVCKAFARRS